MKKLDYKVLGASCLAISCMIFNTSQLQAAVTFWDGSLQYAILTEKGSTGTVELISADLPFGVDNFTIPSSVENGGITYSVTSVKNGVFFDCQYLMSITIDKNVTSLGNCPFGNCKSLTNIVVNSANPNYSSIGGVLFNKDKTILVQYPSQKEEKDYTIPKSVTSIGVGAFMSCKNLPSITIPNSVTSIGDAAFYNCNALKSVTIGNKVTSIGNKAFYHCIWLNSVNMLGNVTSIGEGAFYGCRSLASVAIPDSVTSIGGAAFDDCDRLPSILFSKGKKILVRYSPFNRETSYIIPDTVTFIANNAFSQCLSLKNVTISKNVTSIGNGAFYGCEALTGVTIGNKVTSIGDGTFFNCSNLTSITIPDSVTSIKDAAFVGCISLTNIVVNSTNPNYSSIEGVLFNKKQTVLIQYPAKKDGIDYTIPKSVTSIENSAFFRTSRLTSITIPDSVTTIGDAAFCGCNNLKSVSIGNSVTSIGKEAFFRCSSLANITIPDSVTSIGKSAFGDCNNLVGVYYRGDVPDAYYHDAYNGIYDRSLGLISYYPEKNTTWKAAIDENGQWQNRKVMTWKPGILIPQRGERQTDL